MGNSAKKLSEYFDINIREQVEMAFRTITHDKFFIFSGPANFSSLSDNNRKLCPLLFTQGFALDQRRGGGQLIGSIGTTKTILTPSSGGSNTITIGGFSVISGDPDSSNKNSKGASYTLLKRLYYDAIKFKNGELLRKFLRENNNQDTSFKPIAYDENDIFTNFGESEFYEIPFGLLVIGLTKGNDTIFVRYFEGCRLNFISPIIQVGVGGGAAAITSNNLAITVTKEVPIKLSDVSNLIGATPEEDKGFINTLLEYIGEQ